MELTPAPRSDQQATSTTALGLVLQALAGRPQDPTIGLAGEVAQSAATGVSSLAGGLLAARRRAAFPGRRWLSGRPSTTDLAVRPDCPLSAPSVGARTLRLACALAEEPRKGLGLDPRVWVTGVGK